MKLRTESLQWIADRLFWACLAGLEIASSQCETGDGPSRAHFPKGVVSRYLFLK
jgi:hypothetical protein